MAIKLNCWEFKKCGREPGGTNNGKDNTCPAASKASANGINGGINGGRICWSIAGTLSNEKVEGTFAKELFSCMSCDFSKLVNKEENVSNYEILTSNQLHEFLTKRKKTLSRSMEIKKTELHR